MRKGYQVHQVYTTHDVHLKRSSSRMPWEGAPSHNLAGVTPAVTAAVTAAGPSPAIAPLQNLGNPRPPAGSLAPITSTPLAIKSGSLADANWAMSFPTADDDVASTPDTGDPSWAISTPELKNRIGFPWSAIGFVSGASVLSRQQNRAVSKSQARRIHLG